MIERTRWSNVMRPLQQGVVVQANHHVAARLTRNNDMVALMEDNAFLGVSGERATCMERALRAARDMAAVIGSIDKVPV